MKQVISRCEMDVLEAVRDCAARKLDITTSAIQLYLYYRDGSKDVYTRQEIVSMCQYIASRSRYMASHWLDR